MEWLLFAVDDRAADPEHPASPPRTRPRPSLARGRSPRSPCLPFDNLSGETGADDFSDGITGDLITAPSKISDLLVIAWHSIFACKTRASDLQTVGSTLGVRYVLRGSVRPPCGRVRVTAQLLVHHILSMALLLSGGDAFSGNGRVVSRKTCTAARSLRVGYRW